VNGGKFQNERSRVENYLLEVGENQSPFISLLITHQIDDVPELLDSIKETFGLEFFERIFNVKSQMNLWQYVAKDSVNLPVLLKWMRLNFPDYMERNVDNIGLSEFLHYAFRNMTNEKLLETLEEIENLKEIWGMEALKKLFLLNPDKCGNFTFLYEYVNSPEFDNGFLLKFLDGVKKILENDQETLFKLIMNLNVNHLTLFHYYCIFADKFDLLNIIKWINDSLGADNLIKYLMLEDEQHTDAIIFHYAIFQSAFVSIEPIVNYLKIDLKMDERFLKNSLKLTDDEFIYRLIRSKVSLFFLTLDEANFKFVKYKFGSEFLKNLIFDDSLFSIIGYEWNSRTLAEDLLRFFDVVERECGLKELKKLVGFKNARNETFLYRFSTDGLLHCTNIVNYLFLKFGDDKNFVKRILYSVDEYGNTILHFFFQKYPVESSEVAPVFFDMIKSNFNVNFLKEFLLIKNDSHQNFFHIAQAHSVDNALKLLGVLLEIVGNDKKFFENLVKQEKIPEKIKLFMMVNFIMSGSKQEKRQCILS
jgi:hypothetical protein